MPLPISSDLLESERTQALKVLSAFRGVYPESKPLLVRSPGRVNLIGEHTDYNEGFVLPAAVDKAIYFAVAPASGSTCALRAVDLDESWDFDLDRIAPSERRWPNYLIGVVDQFFKAGARIGAFRCAFGGDVPVGSGMSSSAAIEAGLAFALNRLFVLGFDSLGLVKLAQKAENEFVGVRCGIMDQFANIFGRTGSVLKLDCRSLSHAYYPFERSDLRIVLCDTRVKRELASSEYNVRRGQCEAGVQALARHDPSLRSLRDVPLGLLQAHRAEIEPVILRRCEYVIRENGRVEAACADLEKSDFNAFGRRMFASHEGLRDDYEVSCRELDILVDAASAVSGVLGARMMGAGFGGCTINLVEDGAVGELALAAAKAFRDAFGRDPAVYISRLRSGTREISI